MEDDTSTLSAREKALFTATKTYRERIAELEAALEDATIQSANRLTVPEVNALIAAEREECAKIADIYVSDAFGGIAAAIRARGTT